MTIIGLVAIGALGALGADLRTADQARQLLPAAALAQERMAVLELADAHTLRVLPDSLARGVFASPHSAYSWVAHTKEVKGEPSLVDVELHVVWTGGDFVLRQRHYRPSTLAGTNFIAGTVP
jgi:hypothetical protein